MTPAPHFPESFASAFAGAEARVRELTLALRHTIANEGDRSELSQAQRAKRKRREKLAKASRRRNRR